MQNRRLQSGFSVIELLVATAILGIVTSQILGVVGAQQRNFTVQQDLLETQEDSRLVADLMLKDLRMAGFMVPNRVGVGSVDGGSAGSDVLCASDADTIDVGTLTDMTWRFQGATLASAISGATGSITLTAATLDIDGDSTVDFAVNGGIIISDGTRSHCARITAIDTGSGSVQFTPSTPTGFVVNTTDTRVAPGIVYEITGNGLERNGLLFSRQVEDLQVEFNVDGTWGNSLDGSDPDDVSMVRLSVVARTDRDDLSSTTGSRPSVANHAAGAADTFRRRVLTNVVAPRNFM